MTEMHRAVGGLGVIFEEEGRRRLISLIESTQRKPIHREHSGAVRTRAPFGVPNDAAFQRRVLIAALELLDRDRPGTRRLS